VDGVRLTVAVVVNVDGVRVTVGVVESGSTILQVLLSTTFLT